MDNTETLQTEEKINDLNIGASLIVAKDFELELEGSDETLSVRKGDLGFVDSRGSVHYTSGEAKGVIQQDACEKSELVGYDTINMAIMIEERLNDYFGMRMFLEDKDIETVEFVSVVADELMNILRG